MASISANKLGKSRYLNVYNLILFLTLSQAKLYYCSLCQNFNYVSSDTNTELENPLSVNGKINIGNYTCPGATDPKLHTECCNTPDMRGCCPKARYFYEIDQTLASIIAITVTSSCIVFAIIIAICCFWSRCPLYSACRVEFSHDIATYVSKEDSIDMDTMPTEFSGKANNKFSPVVVSNGNLPLECGQ